ncbi:hypothetical protein LEP1GSC021_2832 [Leptospira noguchii str. 1993005606]|uniref:SLEI domain protein, PF07620 family n=1 Tax=Leptospira noguchii str. 2007001578 TaxID=1049974 RepID=A0ABN0IY86_9LEPT|nr:hypothetical protein LEP1GSC035_1275 [Leptospira noguchii str. 2007001578]EPE85065.1 hypothetical protein LEP1GSC021_2832 [Leptospira noguchii str. 1993005606]
MLHGKIGFSKDIILKFHYKILKFTVVPTMEFFKNSIFNLLFLLGKMDEFYSQNPIEMLFLTLL